MSIFVKFGDLNKIKNVERYKHIYETDILMKL